MIEVESMQLGRLLHLHTIAEYDGLNAVEVQLRKKGFWLLFLRICVRFTLSVDIGQD